MKRNMTRYTRARSAFTPTQLRFAKLVLALLSCFFFTSNATADLVRFTRDYEIENFGDTLIGVDSAEAPDVIDPTAGINSSLWAEAISDFDAEVLVPSAAAEPRSTVSIEAPASNSDAFALLQAEEDRSLTISDYFDGQANPPVLSRYMVTELLDLERVDVKESDKLLFE